jgi:tetratricopeptide (TPR) repeat protein
MSRPWIAALVLLALAGCGGMQEGSLFDREFWANSPLKERSIESELGIAAMARGDYAKAETHFDKALKQNPKDVYALLGRGMLYQNTNQKTKARAMFEAILAIRPADTEQMVVWSGFSTRPVSEIASVQLALIQSGGVPTAMEKGMGGGEGGPMAPAAAPLGVGLGMSPGTEAAPDAAQADVNVFSRFETLRMLRDQGLITPDEFAARRQANLGALLPLSAPPPAAGLDRPVPPSDQIAGRLRAIGRALEMRALTIGQHSAERAMILDALLPEAPVQVANPAPPPKGLMEAADAVRRLEKMKAEKLITSDEYAKERAAVEGALQPAPAMAKPAAVPAPAAMPKETVERGAPAVHLASYKTRQAADRGWSQIRRAHGDLLGKLKAEISEVDLGPGKGKYFRLRAGPLPSPAAADDLCAKLKKRRQFCEPAVMGG